jgi:hypothetical protein
MRLRIASKRTLGDSVLLAAELSKPVADKHSTDYQLIQFVARPASAALLTTITAGEAGRSPWPHW